MPLNLLIASLWMTAIFGFYLSTSIVLRLLTYSRTSDGTNSNLIKRIWASSTGENWIYSLYTSPKGTPKSCPIGSGTVNLLGTISFQIFLFLSCHPVNLDVNALTILSMLSITSGRVQPLENLLHFSMKCTDLSITAIHSPYPEATFSALSKRIHAW